MIFEKTQPKLTIRSPTRWGNRSGGVDMWSKYEKEASLFRREKAHHLLSQRSLAGSKALRKESNKGI
jgi:hypothetical protein